MSSKVAQVWIIGSDDIPCQVIAGHDPQGFALLESFENFGLAK